MFWVRVLVVALMKKIVILDNGHGENTPGKRSPDGQLREYSYCREIVKDIKDRLTDNYEVFVLVPETKDISLNERIKRANAICSANPDAEIVLISVHLNAAGDGSKWYNASGWSGWISNLASAKSKRLAQCLYSGCEIFNLQGNRNVPKEKYWVANFAIVSKTKCPAVLTENLFQDNKQEVDFLLSKEGKEDIIGLHVFGIEKYFNTL